MDRPLEPLHGPARGVVVPVQEQPWQVAVRGVRATAARGGDDLDGGLIAPGGEVDLAHTEAEVGLAGEAGGTGCAGVVEVGLELVGRTVVVIALTDAPDA